MIDTLPSQADSERRLRVAYSDPSLAPIFVNFCNNRLSGYLHFVALQNHEQMEIALGFDWIDVMVSHGNDSSSELSLKSGSNLSEQKQIIRVLFHGLL